ncbi:MAG: FKBP-type peptidyl-prolyl cis-trans isomerase [Bacteroidota bacterium]
MRKILMIGLAASFVLSSVSAQKKKVPVTDKEKISYCIGVNLGQNFAMQGIDVDPNMLLLGIKDILSKKSPAMTDQDMQTTMMNFQKSLITKAGEKNKKEGEAFLEANKNKADVVTLPSGLQYKVISMGNGPKPTATQTVKCNYRGMLVNGKEFDNSYKRGTPAELPLDHVIKGWADGIQLMPTGSKWEFYIPSDLAYGEQGEPRGGIGPNSVLIFEVELLEIK